ncbi:MAG: hypothetical protein V4497_01195 [Bacteroidota bacterium]
MGYARALISPVESLYYSWYNWRIDNIYKLEHNGQICYLRGSLNDKFDPVERRIYIGNGLLYDTQYIFTEAEEQDVWLETEDEEETIWLRTESETADTGLDFIVYVPETIFNSQIDGLKAHIEFYKAGGKRYSILIDE